MTDMRGAILAITGGRGVGKSTLCARVVEAARQRDLSVAGVITERDSVASVESAERDPASWESTPAGPAAARGAAGGRRYLVDLGTGERMPLGRVCSTSEQAEPAAAGKRGPVDGGAASNRGAAVYERKAADERGPVDEQCPASRGDTLAPGFRFDPEVFERGARVLAHATPCDLLVVDELGPIELLGGRGWANALEVLRPGNFGTALVVCRPELLEILEAELGGSHSGRMTVVVMTEENRDTLAVELGRGVCGGIS
jgi:nucleoside-triphosphatase THEP1